MKCQQNLVIGSFLLGGIIGLIITVIIVLAVQALISKMSRK